MLSLQVRVALCVAALTGLMAPGGNDRPPLFTEISSASGLQFTHVNGAAGRYFMPELLGAGAALFDYDGDGDLDVYLLQGQPLGADNAPSTLTHRLYRNDLVESGRLRFVDVTEATNAGVRAYGMGAAVGDYDSDGDLDLYLTAFGSNTLLRNERGKSFTDVTKEAGVDDPRWSASAAFVDYDRDGDLDLFVTNYLEFTLAANRQCFDATGARDYCGPREYRPVPDRLFRNEGNGRFSDASDAAGITRAYGNGLGVATGDYNGDGWPDIYVADDATPNQLWINQHDGTFVDEGPLSGAALSAAGNPEGSMGIASGDHDDDGDEDLFVTNVRGETFAFYVNDGHAAFDDARVRTGIAAITASFTGFGTDWFDYDHDGRLDLFVANGAVQAIEALRGEPAPYRMVNLLLHNAGGRFEDVSAQGGDAFRLSEVSRAAAFGDIDNDGDIDIVVTNNNGPVRLLRNDAAANAAWLQIVLDQPAGNRLAIGARVAVERQGRPTLWRRVKTDGSYLAASDSRVHFGLGDYRGPSVVFVQWPDGPAERWPVGQVNRLLHLERGAGEPVPKGKVK
jgi:hypothetical protein